MMNRNTIPLNDCCGNCGWYNQCGCSANCGCGCANGCGNACANGCHNGCANGCGGCANGCGWIGGCSCNSHWNSSCGCSGCGNCSAGCLWPNLPPLASGGMLAPRIVASGRALQRACDLTLCVQDIPECAQAPYALIGVAASGPSDWEFISVEQQRAVLRVTIPLTAQIRDCSGCVYNGHSSVTVDVPVNITIAQQELSRANVTVMPGVRLLCTSGCSNDGCFTVSLAILVDVYVTQWELSADGITVPCRPDLPLTLPPSFNRCCR